MSDSPELATVKKYAPLLEATLKRCDRELVHFLRNKGFLTDDAHDEILNARSILTEAQKAGELVKWIENRIKMDPSSFHSLLDHLKQSGPIYQPIVNAFEATSSRAQHIQHHDNHRQPKNAGM